MPPWHCLHIYCWNHNQNPHLLQNFHVVEKYLGVVVWLLLVEQILGIKCTLRVKASPDTQSVHATMGAGWMKG